MMNTLKRENTMNNRNDAKDSLNNLVEKSQDKVKQSKQEMKESMKDWYGYIQEHPLQSMLFGITVYFALKGLLKD